MNTNYNFRHVLLEHTHNNDRFRGSWTTPKNDCLEKLLCRFSLWRFRDMKSRLPWAFHTLRELLLNWALENCWLPFIYASHAFASPLARLLYVTAESMQYTECSKSALTNAGASSSMLCYRKSYKSLDRFRSNKTTKPVSTSLILKNLEDFYGMIRMLGRKFIIRNVWARWFLYLFGSSHIFQAVERGEWSKNKGRLFKWNEALVKIYGDKWYNRVIAAHTEGCLNRDGCMMVMMFYWCLLCV